MLEPADALWAREPLGTALEHSVWERNTEAPAVNREEEFIGVDLVCRPAQGPPAAHVDAAIPQRRDDLAEVTELIAIGAGSLWQSLGELMRSDRRR